MPKPTTARSTLATLIAGGLIEREGGRSRQPLGPEEAACRVPALADSVRVNDDPLPSLELTFVDRERVIGEQPERLRRD